MNLFLQLVTLIIIIIIVYITSLIYLTILKNIAIGWDDFWASLDLKTKECWSERERRKEERGGAPRREGTSGCICKLILIAGNKSFLSDRVMLSFRLQWPLLSRLAAGEKIISTNMRI